MIVFYTRYNTIHTFGKKEFLTFAFECAKGMRNLPESLRNITSDDSDGKEWKEGRNIIAYEVDEENNIVAFRVGIVDEKDELWTTDLVLDCTKHEIQLRLAREKTSITAEYDKNFNLPYIFKKLIRDGIGGMDNDLPISDQIILIDSANLDKVVNIINKKVTYSLPVIYVSKTFHDDSLYLDVDELAKDMAGSAHVLVESDSSLSGKLRNLTNAKNAYNGAIDVFYNDDYFRYLKHADITNNQFRYKITRAIYVRLAMRNIGEIESISGIRIRKKCKNLENVTIETNKLGIKIEELENSLSSEKEFSEYASEEIKSLEKRVNELENRNYELNKKIDGLTESLNKKKGLEENCLSLNFTEEEFYKDEIKRIILESISNHIKKYGDSEKLRRDYHVLKDIVINNQFSEVGNTIKQQMLQIIRKNKLNSTDVSELKGLGFELQTGKHNKYIFHNDDRYIITVSNTPSAFRDGENLAHEAINLIFGRT